MKGLTKHIINSETVGWVYDYSNGELTYRSTRSDVRPIQLFIWSELYSCWRFDNGHRDPSLDRHYYNNHKRELIIYEGLGKI